MAGNEYLGPVDADGNCVVRLAIEDYYSDKFEEARELSNEIYGRNRRRDEQIMDIDDVYDYLDCLSPRQAFEYGTRSSKLCDDEYYIIWKRKDGVGLTYVGNPKEIVMNNISNNWKDIARGRYEDFVPDELRRKIERLMSQPGGTASKSIKRTETSKARTPARKAPAKKATSRTPARAPSRRY